EQCIVGNRNRKPGESAGSRACASHSLHRSVHEAVDKRAPPSYFQHSFFLWRRSGTRGAMPMFVVETNVAKDAVPDALLSEATQDLAKAMGKPAQYIAVRISADQKVFFGGTPDPCALCSLQSIGKISGAQNKQYSKLLCGLLNKHLGIPADRIYINFCDMPAENVGWNSTTFG
ncbi:macrophage migration inhibitory factor-like, partial [Scleropages formosus]